VIAGEAWIEESVFALLLLKLLGVNPGSSVLDVLRAEFPFLD
jgi:hypothetical protein